jgi:hypothetical protein
VPASVRSVSVTNVPALHLSGACRTCDTRSSKQQHLIVPSNSLLLLSKPNAIMIEAARLIPE